MARALQDALEPDTRAAGAYAGDETSAAVKAFGARDGDGWLTSAALRRAHTAWGGQMRNLLDRLGAEAAAIASLLRDAHAQFTELRGRLGAVRREALAAGLRVSERGVSADGADDSAVRSWQERIDHAVRAVSDADEGVRLGLTSAVDGGGAGRGFNGSALGDVERYEALAAERPLERLSRGGRRTRRTAAGVARQQGGVRGRPLRLVRDRPRGRRAAPDEPRPLRYLVKERDGSVTLRDVEPQLMQLGGVHSVAGCEGEFVPVVRSARPPRVLVFDLCHSRGNLFRSIGQRQGPCGKLS